MSSFAPIRYVFTLPHVQTRRLLASTARQLVVAIAGFGPFMVGASGGWHSSTVMIALLAVIYLIDIIATCS
jgi:hypothetical protein